MDATKINMQGGGYYNSNSTLQGMAIEACFAALGPIKFDGGSITLADYGSSEGHNTLRLFQQVLNQVTSVSSATLAFVDTPSNDFSSLASNITESLPGLSQSGKRVIHPLLVPKSHFQQVLPNDFIDAGFSFTALHWLQHMPPAGHQISDTASLSGAAHSDLIAFLSARYREVRHGGTLTLCMPADGQLSFTPVIKCLFDTIQAISGKYQVHESTIHRMPFYLRTMEEIVKAIEGADGQWKILGKALVPLEHPASALATTQTDDASAVAANSEAYARAMAGFCMAVISGFLIQDAKASMGSEYPGDARFLEDMSSSFAEVFLRSYAHEKVGFTYALIRLRKT